ncbi:MAG: 2 protein [Acidobacteriota bacterium]|nr:2 protein [Acidobacteriota bacterium]
MNQAKFNIIVLLILFSLNLLAFLPTVKGDFIWDDRDLILDNPLIQSSSFLKSVLFSPFDVLTTDIETGKKFAEQTHFYRPLILSSYWLDFQVWGFNPAGFHLTNIFIHMVCAILLFFIAVGFGFERIYALFSAILFSLYPLHFENTAWISGRTDLLSFLFAAVAVLFFLRYLKRNTGANLLCSSFFFFLSLLSKENCILLPAIFFLILLRDDKPLKRALAVMAPYLVSLAIWLVIRQLVLKPTALQVSWQAIQNFFSLVGFYTFKSLFPFHLSISIESQDIFSNTLFLALGLAVLAGLVALGVLIILKKGRGIVSQAIAAFYLLLIPSAAIVFVDTARSMAAWRFLYAPSAVLMGLLAYCLTKIIKSRDLQVAIVVLLGLVYVSELYPKNIVFGQKEKDFWVHMENIERESLLVQLNAAAALLFVDENKALSIYNHILEKQEGQSRYTDYQTMIQENLAAYYSTRGDFQKAKYYYECVLKRGKPSNIEFHFNYATFLSLTEEQARAKSIVADLLLRNPGNHKCLSMSAKFYIRLKEYEKAVPLLKEDYRLFNTSESLHLLKLLKAN